MEAYIRDLDQCFQEEFRRNVSQGRGHIVTIRDLKPFDRASFLATEGQGRRLVHIKPRGTFFAQGGPSNCVFYLQTGRAKLTVVSQAGKEATITLLGPGDFIGEEAAADSAAPRPSTASAITACTALRIDRDEMHRVLKDEHSFSHFFVSFLLARGMRTQADLVDQLFNSSEKRLARTLLLMADFGQSGQPKNLIPEITQEALAEIIGTTRSRVSFFMNRFRKLGYIEYNGRIHINKSLLNVVLHDQLPEQNSSRPVMVDKEHTAQSFPRHLREPAGKAVADARPEPRKLLKPSQLSPHVKPERE
jgi:CRP-like cAMP-binding protein